MELKRSPPTPTFRKDFAGWSLFQASSLTRFCDAFKTRGMRRARGQLTIYPPPPHIGIPRYVVLQVIESDHKDSYHVRCVNSKCKILTLSEYEALPSQKKKKKSVPSNPNQPSIRARQLLGFIAPSCIHPPKRPCPSRALR